jgi:hypothetical protein
MVATGIAPVDDEPAIPFVANHSSGRGARRNSCWAKAIVGSARDQLSPDLRNVAVAIAPVVAEPAIAFGNCDRPPTAALECCRHATAAVWQRHARPLLMGEPEGVVCGARDWRTSPSDG